MRLERVRDQAGAAEDRRERRTRQLALLESESPEPQDQADELPDAELPRLPDEGDEAARAAWDALSAGERMRALELELERLDADAEERRGRELAGLDAALAAARARATELSAAVTDRRAALDAAERAADEARTRRREAEQAVQAARTRAADAGAELAAAQPPGARRRRCPWRRAGAGGRTQGRARIRARALAQLSAPASPPRWSRTSPRASGCSTARTAPGPLRSWRRAPTDARRDSRPWPAPSACSRT